MNIESSGRPPIVPPFPFCPSGAGRAVDVSRSVFMLEEYQSGGVAADGFKAYNGVFRGDVDSDMITTEIATYYTDPDRQEAQDSAILELAHLAITELEIRQHIGRKICSRVSDCAGPIRTIQGFEVCGALNEPDLDEVLREVAIEVDLLDNSEL